MGTTLRRISAAAVAAVVCATVAVGVAPAASAQDPSIAFYVNSDPTCPTLHADSVDGGTTSFAVVLDGNFYALRDVPPGGQVQVPIQPPNPIDPPDTLGHHLQVLEGQELFLLFEVADVRANCPPVPPPGAPTIGGASPGNGTARVSWTGPPSDGQLSMGFSVTPYDGLVPLPEQGQFIAPTAQLFPGTLVNGKEYRFRVRARNDIGFGPYSNFTKPITVGTPTAPTIGTATAGNGSATVTWTPPASDNGSPIIVYVVTAYVGYNPMVSVFAGPGATSRTVPGLTPGTTYRLRIRPHNAFGAGLFSTVSNAVTPAA